MLSECYRPRRGTEWSSHFSNSFIYPFTSSSPQCVLHCVLEPGDATRNQS